MTVIKLGVRNISSLIDALNNAIICYNRLIWEMDLGNDESALVEKFQKYNNEEGLKELNRRSDLLKSLYDKLISVEAISEGESDILFIDSDEDVKH